MFSVEQNLVHYLGEEIGFLLGQIDLSVCPCSRYRYEEALKFIESAQGNCSFAGLIILSTKVWQSMRSTFMGHVSFGAQHKTGLR